MAADNDTTGPAGPLTHHERQGFLFAVAAAPDLVPPSEWLHEIYGGAEPAFDDMSEAQASLHAIMEMYNDITTAIAERRIALPADCAFHSETLANLDTDAPVAAWSRGFLRGHQWLIESWDPFVPSDMDEEFAMLLITLTFFATPTLAAAYAEELGRPLEEAAALIRRVFPDALAEYAQFGRVIGSVLHAEAPPVRRSSPKTGRNAPCPCGSGRKYKHCCGGQ